MTETSRGPAGKVELPPVCGAGYEPSAASGEPTGVALSKYVALTPCLWELWSLHDTVLYYKAFAWHNMSAEGSLEISYVFNERSSAILTLDRTPTVNITCSEHSFARNL